jgi:hypothetical protein
MNSPEISTATRCEQKEKAAGYRFHNREQPAVKPGLALVYHDISFQHS